MTKDRTPTDQTNQASDSPTETSGKSPGQLAAEFRALPSEVKDRYLPPLGHIVYSILQGPEGTWRRLAFRVSHRNVPKGRVTIEVLGWANEPHPNKVRIGPDPRPESEAGTVTLDVHNGVIGGGSEFKP